MLENDRPTWKNLWALLGQEPEIDIYSPIHAWVDAGEWHTIDDGGTPSEEWDDISVLYLNVDKQPPRVDPHSGRWFSEPQQRNNASLVFKIVYGGVSFLVAGDINGRNDDHKGQRYDDEIDSEERELYDRHVSSPRDFSLKATMFQVPHHGSNGSSSLKFLKAVHPEWVVIPAGHKNYDHPSTYTLRRIRLAGVNDDHVLRTDHGDSTPQRDDLKDPPGDDSFIFEADASDITRILWVQTQ